MHEIHKMDILKLIEKRCADFENVTPELCVDIHEAARTLSLEDCYDFALLDKAQLSPAENNFIEQIHRRGRAIGVKDAGDRLFMHMTTRNGGQSALEYLKQMSGEFSAEVTGTPNKGFSFNITIPEPDEK